MKHLYTSLLLVLLVACNDDFLNKLPQDSVAPETFYSKGANLEPGLMGVYDAMQAWGAYGNLTQLDAISDNAILNKDGTEFINFAKGEVSSNNTAELANYYLYPYQVVQRANELLFYIDTPGDITPESRASVKAEGKALRAFAYMQLVYLYGDVPLDTIPLSRRELLSLKRTPRDEVVNFILSELNKAALALQDKPYNNQVGRLTKQAVLGMRSRVLVYEARKGKKNWGEVKDALTNAITIAEKAGAKLVTSGNGLDGFSNYQAVFATNNESNVEMLFSIKFDNALQQGNGIYANYGPTQGGGQARMGVHTNFIDDFYTTDGLPITDPASIYNSAKPYTNRDPRLRVHTYLPNETYPFGVYTGRSGNPTLPTDYAFKKFSPTGNDIAAALNFDMPVLRYADLLLMFAEAANEVNNGPSAEAYDAINKVRQRAAMPTLPAGLSKEKFKQEVIHERRVEFGFEGLRWFDLTTLGIANERINAITELNRKFIPNKQQLFPMPQSEIDMNKSLAPNNPGY